MLSKLGNPRHKLECDTSLLARKYAIESRISKESQTWARKHAYGTENGNPHSTGLEGLTVNGNWTMAV